MSYKELEKIIENKGMVFALSGWWREYKLAFRLGTLPKLKILFWIMLGIAIQITIYQAISWIDKTQFNLFCFN